MSERLLAEAKLARIKKELSELLILTSGLRLNLRLGIPSESTVPDITEIDFASMQVQVDDLANKVEKIKTLKTQIQKIEKEWGF